MFSRIVIISSMTMLAVAGCQQMPAGPTASEGLYNSLVAQCTAQGGRDRRGQAACAQSNSLAMQVASERAQRDSQAATVAQNNAVAVGVAAGAAGLVGGTILGQATAPRYYRGYYGYRCNYYRCW